MNKPPIDLELARELAALLADSAQLMLAAKKLSSTLAHGGAKDPAVIGQTLQSMVCQAGYLMDECTRRVGGTPIYTSADGWTLPRQISSQ